jgi:hypothetical protein
LRIPKEQSETANRRRSFITITKRKWTTGQKPSTKYYTENKKSAQYLKYKKLSTHMPHVERNKSHELEVCGSKVKITITKNKTVI